MEPLLKRGRVYNFGKVLKQYNEHDEDEAVGGNTGDFATNLMTIAEFRLERDCAEVARIINEAFDVKSKADGKQRKRRPRNKVR